MLLRRTLLTKSYFLQIYTAGEGGRYKCAVSTVIPRVLIVKMPSTPVIHSIDIVLDRTDQSLLTESLNGILSL